MRRVSKLLRSAAPALVLLTTTVLALVALPSTARAQQTLYVSGEKSFSAFAAQPDGALTPRRSWAFQAVSQIAFAPDGKHLFGDTYRTGSSAAGVGAYGVAPRGGLTKMPGTPLATGLIPSEIVVSPDGRHLYVPDFWTYPDDRNIYAYNIASDGSLSAMAGSPFQATVGTPAGAALSPDGERLYVITYGGAIVTLRVGADGSLTPSQLPAVPVGVNPADIVVTPDGRHLYVSDPQAGIWVFNTGAGGLSWVSGPQFPSGDGATSLAVSPNGKYLYAGGGSSIWGFEIGDGGALDPVPASPFRSAGIPVGMTASPDGRQLYTTVRPDYNDTNAPASGIAVWGIAPSGRLGRGRGVLPLYGDDPVALGFVPDQPPKAAFATTIDPTATKRVGFNAATSSDVDGAIAAYDWDFGDGTTSKNGPPNPSHTFGAAGDYDVTLTLTDDEGCSTELVYTGQSASCNGSATAVHAETVEIAPTLRIETRPSRAVTTPGKSAQVKVGFSSEPGATFSCKLERSTYEPCTSPYSATVSSKPGRGKRHRISIKPRAGGNAGRRVAVEFRVVQRKRALREPQAGARDAG